MPELKPLFRRYWVKILPDGSAISQFDLEGNYVKWSDEISATKVMFLPFSLEFAGKVRSKGDLAEASNLPVLEFDCAEAKYHRHVVYHHITRTACQFCGATLEDNAVYCPRCLGRNWYYCDMCDALKDKPLIKLELQTFGGMTRWIRIPYALMGHALKVVHNLPGRWGIKNVQILCPDCKEPRGLLSVNCIVDQVDQTLHSTHVLEIDGSKHLIIDAVRS